MVDPKQAQREQQEAQARRELMICLRVTDMVLTRCLVKLRAFRGMVSRPTLTREESDRMLVAFQLADRFADDLEELYDKSEILP